MGDQVVCLSHEPSRLAILPKAEISATARMPTWSISAPARALIRSGWTRRGYRRPAEDLFAQEGLPASERVAFVRALAVKSMSFKAWYRIRLLTMAQGQYF